MDEDGSVGVQDGGLADQLEADNTNTLRGNLLFVVVCREELKLLISLCHTLFAPG